MIIRAAGKFYPQSTARQNYPLFCLMISRLTAGVFMPQSFSFLFQQCTHLQGKHENPLVFIFSSFCLLLIHIAVWRPFLHLHPTACRRIWPLIGQILRAVNRCGQACGVKLLVSFFSLLPQADLVLYARPTAAMHILCAFAENASLQNGDPHGLYGGSNKQCWNVYPPSAGVSQKAALPFLTASYIYIERI